MLNTRARLAELPLKIAIEQTCFAYLPSHKHIDVYTRDIVKQLRQNNINLAEVYNIIGGFFGSMENVPLMERSLRNLCGKINRDHVDDDVKKTVDVFAEIEAWPICWGEQPLSECDIGFSAGS